MGGHAAILRLGLVRLNPSHERPLDSKMLADREFSRSSPPHAILVRITGMVILLSALGVAIGAFCVWLIVRIVNRRERWAKWTAVVLIVVFVVYPLSIGPACWLERRGWIPRRVTDCAYAPLFYLVRLGATEGTFIRIGPFGGVIVWYVLLWESRAGKAVPFDPSEYIEGVKKQSDAPEQPANLSGDGEL